MKWIPEPHIVGIRDLVGTGIAPVSKETAVKAHFYPNLISSKYPDFIFVGNETHFSYFFQIASLMTQQLEKRSPFRLEFEKLDCHT